MRQILRKRPPAPCFITCTGSFDLNDFSAHGREQLSAIRTANKITEFQYFDTRKSFSVQNQAPFIRIDSIARQKEPIINRIFINI
jgi:hypothetical protein